MMLIATLAMAEDKAANRHPRGWARAGFWFGAAISTAANVAATVVQHGWEPLAIGVAALAPLLLLWAIEIVARPGKPKSIPATAAEPAISVAEPTADEAAISVAELESPDLPEAPVSPAVPAAPAAARKSGKKSRGQYGPRDGERYSERHDRRIRNGR